MITNHLTEDELQQYALDKSIVAPDLQGHLQHCEECTAKLAVYQLLITEINQQPVATFDFDLSAAVIAQLPAPVTKASTNKYPVAIFSLVAILLAGSLIYLYRDDLLALFTNTNMAEYLGIVIITSIAIIQGIDTYRNYQKKIKALDFS
ncbi:MAG: hypothetical protein ABI480_05410 [Chitinophagaceae bacterium]